MSSGVPLTPDILSFLKDSPSNYPLKRRSDSTQFLLFLVVVTTLLLSTFPLLLRQSNQMFGAEDKNRIIPILNPSPTPDSSLLFFINKDK